MAIEFEYAPGATPLDAQDAAALRASHVTTRGQVDELEFQNVSAGMQWAYGRKGDNILTVEFMLELHRRMFGDTWSWAGKIRAKPTLPVGAPPGQIRSGIQDLCADVVVQLKDGAWALDEIAARFHHRLVYIHPFTNGNGRFCRVMADVMLIQRGEEPFSWGENLGRKGGSRERYVAALVAADGKDYRPLFSLLGVPRQSVEKTKEGD